MKTLIIILLFLPFQTISQITSPVIRANFGIDGDLDANYFNLSASSGNDDWFRSITSGDGVSVIDTTGAAWWMNQYMTNPASRLRSLVKFMNEPMYSVVNGQLLYDALFVRDFHDNDSTVFVISNKNAQNPRLWSGGTSAVPQKNEIKDVLVHIRRAGESLKDSLWLIGGLSLEGTTGNRYFDFELYQTDIYFDMTTGQFKDYGLDSGHTAWQFDEAGNIKRAGDIIFSAEFSSSSLSYLEGRIWVHRDALKLSPTQFNWGGNFDADGTNAFGYASIIPNTIGGFYTGLQSNDTWAGPFGYVDYQDGVTSNYTAGQFLEISVNLTKL
jgi:hypothetical protein